MVASQQLVETNKKAILIFDGDCGFCTSSANWISSNSDRFQIKPWQSLDLSLFGLTEDEVSSAVYWIDGTDKYSGHVAIGKSLRANKNRLFQALGSVLLFKPFGPIFIIAYKILARYRHKLPGSTTACKI